MEHEIAWQTAPSSAWPHGEPYKHVTIDAADLRLILAALDEQGWRPIETAPRDGTIILIAINVRGDGPKVYEARWNEISECFSGRNGFLLFDGAHAWRPLPAPPVEKDKG